MRRAGAVAIALVAIVIAEIVVFVAMVKLIGLAWTLLLLIATSLAGGWLGRREGVRSWRRFRAALVEGRPPGREATSGLLGLVGALLLLLPGFLTDIVGALLILPPTRAFAAAGVQRAAEHRISPALAGDFFGPRRVRVRRGRATPAGSPTGGPSTSGPSTPGAPAGAITAIEGEIVGSSQLPTGPPPPPIGPR
jgi:UPF0716 protein FxsA